MLATYIARMNFSQIYNYYLTRTQVSLAKNTAAIVNSTHSAILVIPDARVVVKLNLCV